MTYKLNLKKTQGTYLEYHICNQRNGSFLADNVRYKPNIYYLDAIQLKKHNQIEWENKLIHIYQINQCGFF